MKRCNICNKELSFGERYFKIPKDSPLVKIKPAVISAIGSSSVNVCAKCLFTNYGLTELIRKD